MEIEQEELRLTQEVVGNRVGVGMSGPGRVRGTVVDHKSHD